MRLLDRYVLTEWLKAFGMATVAICGLLIIEDVQDDLPDFLGWGASAGEIFKYYLFLIPSFLPLIIPIALLVSTLFALGNLHRRGEIIAMRASGLPLLSISRSILAVGLLMAAVVLYLNASLVPTSMEHARTLRMNLKFASEATRTTQDNIGLIRNLTFDNHSSKRLWVMNRFSEYTLQGYGVTVYILDENKRDVGRVMAREAFFDEVNGYWTMVEGQQLTFDPETEEAIFQKRFDSQSYPDFRETPEMMKQRSKEPAELSFLEVRSLLQAIPPEDNPDMRPYAVRYHAALASPFVCFAALLVGIPFAVSGVRTGAMVNIIKAAGLFFVFFVIASLSQLLGSQGALPVVLSVWLPNVAILGVAYWLWRGC